MKNKSAAQLTDAKRDIDKYLTSKQPIIHFRRVQTRKPQLLKVSNSIIELQSKIEDVQNLVKRKVSKPNLFTSSSRSEADFDKEAQAYEHQNNNTLQIPKNFKNIHRQKSEAAFKIHQDRIIDSSFQFQPSKGFNQNHKNKAAQNSQKNQQIIEGSNSPNFVISVLPPIQSAAVTSYKTDLIHHKSHKHLGFTLRNDTTNSTANNYLCKNTENNDNRIEQTNSIPVFKDSLVKNKSQKTIRPIKLNKSEFINIKDTSVADPQQKINILIQFPPPPLTRNISIIQGFQLGRVLGKGMFGQVYLAKHIETGFIVALKKLSKIKLKQFNMVEQFIKQIKLHSSLENPKIVKFYGFFQQKQHFYLVIEYMNEGTLFNYLNKVKKLSIRQAVDFLKDIIEALLYLHKRRIAHRDIKPQNIVLSGGTAKLCDFGWSAYVKSTRQTYCGTLDYISPEMIEKKHYDWSVDIWSVGVLTYELFLGRAPFEDKNRKKVMNKIVNVDIMGIPFTSKLPEQARYFIEALLQKEPQKRPKITQLLNFPLFASNMSKRRELAKQ